MLRQSRKLLKDIDQKIQEKELEKRMGTYGMSNEKEVLSHIKQNMTKELDKNAHENQLVNKMKLALNI